MRCRHKTKPPRFQAKPPADNPGTPPDPIWDTGRSSLSAGDYSSPARPGDRGETFTRRGYTLRHWDEGDLGYWAVSDASPDEFAKFERAFCAMSGTGGAPC